MFEDKGAETVLNVLNDLKSFFCETMNNNIILYTARGEWQRSRNRTDKTVLNQLNKNYTDASNNIQIINFSTTSRTSMTTARIVFRKPQRIQKKNVEQISN